MLVLLAEADTVLADGLIRSSSVILRRWPRSTSACPESTASKSCAACGPAAQAGNGRRRPPGQTLRHAPKSSVRALGKRFAAAGARRARVGERALELSAREWAVREYLLQQAGRVVSKQQVMEAVAPE